MLYTIIKRLLDILIAIWALCILAPVFLIVIILLSFTGEREILYFQKRIGYRNKSFDIWKFATMLKNSPNIGTGEITLRNDPRVTPVGKLLRMTKINELPQIINVLKGDMSIVGPRPLMEVSFMLYPENVRDLIYTVRPGITGIGSIVFRDEEKILSQASDPKAMYAQIYPYKAELELWYIKNKSLYVDVMIIFMTAWLILFPKSDIVRRTFKDLPPAPSFITS